MSNLPNDERLLELLAERALRGLDPEASRELDLLLDRYPGVVAGEFDAAVAAADLAFAQAEAGAGAETEELPEMLRVRIRRDAERHLPVPEPRAPRRTGVWVRSPLLGWVAAAAVLAGALLLTGREPEPVLPYDPTTERDRLIGQAADLIQVEWAPSDDPVYGAVTGDVVWSSAAQQGFMRLSGLPVNDPDESQYQLWIVDPARDANPVDGGVFDITSSGEVIVPIDAKLAIGTPAAFAITVEKPGGVVVSAGPLRVVAPVQG